MYREGIGQFISQKQARLYIPKNGGLNDYVTRLLKEIGVGNDGSFERPGQSDGRLEVIPARGEDIGQRVEDCIARGDTTYGLTGDDLFDEYRLGNGASGLGVLNTYDWFDTAAQFQRPALCLMNREGRLPQSVDGISVAINSKYERTSRRYLRDRFGSQGAGLTVVSYAGDTETTVSEGTHDWCVEVVYRGQNSQESAMSRSELKVAEIVRFSDISLIGKDLRNPWEEEYGRISRVARNPTGSATSRLLADDNAISKKVGEEAAEFVRAFTLGSEIPLEFNGVVYAMMVAAARQQVAWQEIEADLKSRW